jgi:hypothetical protein
MNETTSGMASKLESMLSALPFGETLGPILVALIILIVGLMIAKFIRKILRGSLGKVAALNRKTSDGSALDLATPIVTVVYYVIVFLVLMAVLTQLGLTSVLDPLKEMANEFVAYIPNVIGAGIVGYIGYMIATLVSDFVGMGLSQVDEKLAQRTGNEDVKISKFGSVFVFAVILLPMIVAALGILDIDAISVPATAMIQELMLAIPNIIAAAVILLVTYGVAKFVVSILGGLLDSMNINDLPRKMGMQGLFTDSFTPTKLVGSAIMFFAMLTASVAAVDKLNIEVLSNIMGRVLEFGGGILVGGVILIIGNFLSTYAHGFLSKSNVALANIARLAILGLVLAMGLKAMGLADNIVNMAFGFTLGSVAVAAALAFGFGGRDAAKQVADHWASKIK